MKIDTGFKSDGTKIGIRIAPLDEVTVEWHRDAFNARDEMPATSKATLSGMVISGFGCVALRIEGAALYRVDDGLLAILGLPGEPDEVAFGGSEFMKVKEAERGE